MAKSLMVHYLLERLQIVRTAGGRSGAGQRSNAAYPRRVRVPCVTRASITTDMRRPAPATGAPTRAPAIDASGKERPLPRHPVLIDDLAAGVVVLEQGATAGCCTHKWTSC